MGGGRRTGQSIKKDKAGLFRSDSQGYTLKETQKRRSPLFSLGWHAPITAQAAGLFQSFKS
jgi:hypothetical protein